MVSAGMRVHGGYNIIISLIGGGCQHGPGDPSAGE